MSDAYGGGPNQPSPKEAATDLLIDNLRFWAETLGRSNDYRDQFVANKIYEHLIEFWDKYLEGLNDNR